MSALSQCIPWPIYTIWVYSWQCIYSFNDLMMRSSSCLDLHSPIAVTKSLNSFDTWWFEQSSSGGLGTRRDGSRGASAGAAEGGREGPALEERGACVASAGGALLRVSGCRQSASRRGRCAAVRFVPPARCRPTWLAVAKSGFSVVVCSSHEGQRALFSLRA